MHIQSADSGRAEPDSYLFGPRQAWFAYAMTISLMIFDYVDRQVIVTIFPHLKAEWGLSDAQLGGLVSIVAVSVAIFGTPAALVADRFSRVKSIAGMAIVWSLASISCMFSGSYTQLFAARAMVGFGEAGYGSVGAAVIAGHFPRRMHASLLGGFFASASVGSVLGVVLGGFIAARWGWKAAFGVVGIPGLALALLYLAVKDYRTVRLVAHEGSARRDAVATAKQIAHAIFRPKTMLWVCLGGAAQLIVVATLWAWLPSYLNRTYGMPADQAGMKAALVVLAGAFGSVIWGNVADRAGRRALTSKLHVVAGISLATMVTLVFAFAAPRWGIVTTANAQLVFIVLGGFMAASTVGPVAAVVLNVMHPSVRATGASVLSLFQNLFGLAAGPFIAGALSDRWGLETAMMFMPSFCIVAAVMFLLAVQTYEDDVRHVREQIAAQDKERNASSPLGTENFAKAVAGH
ncbi:MFS transporter [Rhodoblastus sp. 17X3]|uniref:MFS transporter n=1 Tax=Rhodoblastus sp. 17X3 TaxID=3047026 RepID=UPI0024B7F957|nr:MFS transporter [Rhodoblastus sp. 17X3]MDI9847313.1 MFS transporter [Rhodoblastus sp. 17X3]